MTNLWVRTALGVLAVWTALALVAVAVGDPHWTGLVVIGLSCTLGLVVGNVIRERRDGRRAS